MLQQRKNPNSNPNNYTNINGNSYYTGPKSGIQSNQAAMQDAQKMLGLTPSTPGPSFTQSANLGLKPSPNLAPPLAKPDTTMSLADIIRNPDSVQRNQQFEAYYDEAMKKGLVGQGMTAPNANNFVSSNPNYNPFRPTPTLQEAISKNLPGFTNPNTFQFTQFPNKVNNPTVPISAPGGAPVNVSLADAFGPNSPLKSLFGMPIPRNMFDQEGNLGQGFDPEFFQYLFNMLQFMPSIQVNNTNGIAHGGIPQWY